MVCFEEDKLVIELHALSRADSVETWFNLHNAICDLINPVNQDNITDSFYMISLFLNQSMPDRETLKKMSK